MASIRKRKLPSGAIRWLVSYRGVGIIKLNKLTRPAVNAFRDRLLLRRSEDLTRRVITTLALVSDFAIDRGWAKRHEYREQLVPKSCRVD